MLVAVVAAFSEKGPARRECAHGQCLWRGARRYRGQRLGAWSNVVARRSAPCAGTVLDRFAPRAPDSAWRSARRSGLRARVAAPLPAAFPPATSGAPPMLGCGRNAAPDRRSSSRAFLPSRPAASLVRAPFPARCSYAMNEPAAALRLRSSCPKRRHRPCRVAVAPTRRCAGGRRSPDTASLVR